ncbi:hypothetical protein [Haloarcula marina]|uniref:hypothetical protein n=1 Tax=Haloarcula marina TaxID=2961574 RepID=UPI0020B6F41E|nr:hypothetical protein [Halomicroarcula marina]
MCFERGRTPNWREARDERAEQTERADEADAEPEELPTFLNERGGDLSVLTDGGDGAADGG